MTGPIEAFEVGVRHLGSHGEPVNLIQAQRAFQSAVRDDPGMCDAWMGLAEVMRREGTPMSAEVTFGAYRSRARWGEHTNRLRLPFALVGTVQHLDFGLGIPVVTSDDLVVAQALSYARGGDRKEAAYLLSHEVSVPAPPGVRLAMLLLLRDAQRWTDVEAYDWAGLVDDLESSGDPSLDVLSMVVRFAVAEASAHLGRFDAALTQLNELLGFAEADPDRRSQRQFLWEHLTYLRALILREVGKSEDAEREFGLLVSYRGKVDKYRRAAADPDYRLATVTPEVIASRSDEWDPSTQIDQDTHRAQRKAQRQDELLAEADALMAEQIGMIGVKREVAKIKASTQMSRLRVQKGLAADARGNHMVFTGPPGTGKTTVARALGKYFAALGVVDSDNFVEASRADFVAQHLGNTAPKTNKLIDSALDGVLFIDEAYMLIQEGLSGGDAFGREAVDTLLARMENDRERLVVIIAGYAGEIRRMLAANDGLASRFTRSLEFPSYGAEDLMEILKAMGTRRDSIFTTDALSYLDEEMRFVAATPYGNRTDWRVVDELGNGRFVRNLVEKCEEERDFRYVESGVDLETLTPEQMMTIEQQDAQSAMRVVLESKGIRRG